MKREEIVRMAREAEIGDSHGYVIANQLAQLERFAALVVAAERKSKSHSLTQGQMELCLRREHNGELFEQRYRFTHLEVMNKNRVLVKEIAQNLMLKWIAPSKEGRIDMTLIEKLGELSFLELRDGRLHSEMGEDVTDELLGVLGQQGPSVAAAWQQGYDQGVADERTSEANIGIAGFDAKVNPARNNPYSTEQTAQEPVEWLTGCPECGMDGGCDCLTVEQPAPVAEPHKQQELGFYGRAAARLSKRVKELEAQQQENK